MSLLTGGVLLHDPVWGCCPHTPGPQPPPCNGECTPFLPLGSEGGDCLHQFLRRANNLTSVEDRAQKDFSVREKWDFFFRYEEDTRRWLQLVHVQHQTSTKKGLVGFFVGFFQIRGMIRCVFSDKSGIFFFQIRLQLVHGGETRTTPNLNQKGARLNKQRKRNG